MSTPFYDLASLVLVPSGYKAQKVYAQKPLTTDGQLTFSRASTATRVNSAGLIETVSSNVPRLDYQGATCGPRLNLEPQRTNLATYSEQASQYSLIGATIGSNVLASPDGTTNADSIIEDASNGNHVFYNFGLTTFTAAAYTASVFAKKGSRDWCALQIYDGTQGFTAFFNLNTGVAGTIAGVGTSTITNYGNGWYRCTITATTLAGSTGGIAVYSTAANGSTAYAGTNGLTAGYFYGWQLELGAYATSYIPTLGTSVTRVADAASKTSASALIGQTEGTVFWEIQVDTPSATAHETFINVDGGSFGNTVYIYKTSAAGFIAEMYNSGVLQARFVKSGVTVGVHKLAIGYANNDTALFVDGVQVGTTDTSCTTPAMSRIQLGQNVFGASTDRTAQVLLFKTRLTNAQLAELTTL